MSIILGINCSGFHSSACLLVDGAIRHAICEERLTRVKQDKAFPHEAIRYCCEAAGIPFNDIQQVYIGWNPRHYVSQSDRTLLDALRMRGKLSYLALNELATRTDAEIAEIVEIIRTEKANIEIHFVDHHRAHLAKAFYLSGFATADFLILDGFGENTTGMCGTVSQAGCEILRHYPWPQSMGSFYSAFTDYMGFKADGDEWKVMALSALGDPDRYYEAIRSLIRVDGLRFELDLSYFEHFIFFKPRYFSHKLVELLGPPLEAGAEPGQHEQDIVAAVQRVAEETIFSLLTHLHECTGATDLVVGGGFFMNSVCNGKLLANTPYRRLFIGGSPDDSGISLGSALYGFHDGAGQPCAREMQRHNYFGREYGEAAIRQELDRRKIRYTVLADPPAEAAKRIHAGQILGWFQGASEFGQRALGNRSILADPTRAEMKDAVNASVKYREGFRPFAPAVLKERQTEVLEMPEGETAYFMEKVFPIREAWRARVPAVVHFDGTGRPQTVDAALNPRFHALIKAFETLSGVPLVLNTSFNINGMPLVESPGDAISCFYACGLDALVLGDCLIEK